jgi:type II secretory pathway predicted ATPase ExeA
MSAMAVRTKRMATLINLTAVMAMIDLEGFYGFEHMPFGRGLPVDKLYASHDAEEIMDRLEYAASRQLFAILTGDSGTGKSTMLRRFAGELKGLPYKILYIADSKLTPRAFYKELLRQLGLEAHFFREGAKSQLHREINKMKSDYGLSPVVLADESHLLDKDMLEEIRFLLNCDMDSTSPMALILAGQSELWDKLKLKSREAICQRIDVQCVLNKLDRAKTADYISVHMAYASCNRDIFTDAAIDEIYKFSGGIYRLINKCCISCLMYGAQNRKNLIDDKIAKLIIEYEFSAGGHL